MLLDVDGLSTGWNNGIPSDWELDSSDFEESDLPNSIRRLIDPTGGVEVCLYDATSMTTREQQIETTLKTTATTTTTIK